MFKQARLYALLTFSIALSSCGHMVTVTAENDAFSFGLSTNASYIQGLEIMLSPIDGYSPCDPGVDHSSDGECGSGQLIKKIVNKINLVDEGLGGRVQLSYGGGQRFFSPNDLDQKEVVEEDRPYGGFLYGRLLINNYKPIGKLDESGWLKDRVRSVDFRVGIVGPDSQSDEMQIWWHDVCGCTDPQGWDNQIRNEPGFVYTLSEKERMYFLGEFPLENWVSDIILTKEISVGNVYTGATLGGQLRVGYKLPRDFGGGTFTMAEKERGSGSGWYAYAFIGAAGNIVLQDIFLDGNTFKTSPHTKEKEYFVGESLIGLSAGNDQIEAAISFVFQTDQFRGQEKNHRYGKISVRVNYW